MPLTISIDGKGNIAEADGTSDSVGGTWGEEGSGTYIYSLFTWQKGSGCPAGKYSNKAGLQWYDVGAGNELDFTPTTGTEDGEHIIMTVRCQVLGVLDTLATPGMEIRVGSGADHTTNYRRYTIAGSDGMNGWDGRWKPFMIDPTIAGTSADVGTFDISAVRWMGVYISVSGLVSGEDIFLSTIQVGNGIRVTGSSTTGWQDILDYCTDYQHATTPRAWNFVQDGDGTLISYGKFFIGDAVNATEITDFADSLKNIKFIVSEFWNGTAWVALHDIDACGLVVEKHASYATDYDCANVNITGSPTLNVDVVTTDATSFSDSGGATTDVDALVFAVGQTISGRTFTDVNSTSLSNTPDKSTWNLSGLITVNSGGGMTGCTINKSIGAISVTIADFTPLVGNTFISDGSNHAVEITTLGDGTLDWDNTTSGYLAGAPASPVIPTSTGNEDIYVNVGSGTVTISVAAGATVPSIRSAGATVNVVSGQVTLRVDVEDADDASVISTARVYLHKKDDPSTVYMSQECGVDGFASESLTYTAPVDMVGWVREFDVTSPDYVTQDIAGTLTASGLTIAVKLKKI